MIPNTNYNLLNGTSVTLALAAEYILSGLENNVFASKFTYVLPNKEKLIAEVESILNKEKL